ncbi:hypothetical protein glysoja_026841 [Glycine soja]|uniref:Uncharacterized protein n=1 Tax=Glycine soja TaxID=3848 RepID=A0A0B2PVQ0_GLYSO|nr:hypothetical protein glysoja_026841 [Glycine soja]
MANEVDFKIELKVSANCCEGSKRKVKKALRNPEACVEEHMPRFEPPPFLRPTERVGDYFSDENTTGCHVM